MRPFRYARATDVESAIALMARQPEACFIAGGTNLLDLMKLNVTCPPSLVDISRLPLTGIEEHADRVRIGALTRNSDLAQHPLIRLHYPVLSEALLAGASPQLRNMATVGGNLLQRTRCTYFNDSIAPCNKRVPGSGCAALNGENRTHAILGTSDLCIATHPSDMAVALVALDASVQAQGPRGTRSIPITDFHLLPGTTPARETVLEHGELIVAIDLPKMSPSARSHYLKIGDRAAYTFALVSVAATLEIEQGSIWRARIALGGIATKPWRAYEAEALLLDTPPDTEVFTAAAQVALQGAQTRKQNAFKITLAQKAIVRVLETLGEIR